MNDVYLGLGSNIGDSYSILQSALKKIEAIEGVEDVRASQFYVTTPVGHGPPQNDYVNAVCRLQTSKHPKKLFEKLQNIEWQLGKKPKLQNEPRTIDIDILFYGQSSYQDADLEIPHPRWQERLFVLIPLSDLVEDLMVPCHLQNLKKIKLSEMIDSFCNVNHESVSLLNIEYAHS